MNSQNVYSDSLKRMIGFKLFPSINPQQIKITQNKSNTYQLKNFTEQKRTDQHIQTMKKQIVQARKKQRQFQKQIDKIVGKLVEKGQAEVVNKKIRKYGSSSRLRIITQPFQNTHRQKEQVQSNKYKYGKHTKLRTQYDEQEEYRNDAGKDKKSPRQKGQWKISLKIQQNQIIQKESSLPRLKQQRAKTESDLKPKKNIQQNAPVQIYEAANAEKLIKHYRGGMTSLKKIKKHKFN